MKGARMCLLNVVEEEAGVASSHQQGWSWILEKHLQACRRGLPSWNHVAGCGWWICYRMADKWLHCARLLCFQSTVCRTRRVYYTRCQMRSLQCSDSQAEPRHAFPSRIYTNRDRDSVWQPSSVLHLLVIMQPLSPDSPNQFKPNSLGNTTESPKYPFFKSPEIQTSRCCYCLNMEPFKPFMNMWYPFIFPLYVIVHVDFTAHSSERPLDSPISLDRFLNCPCLFVVDAIICDWQDEGLRLRRAGASGCSLICICFTPSQPLKRRQ